MLSLIHLCNVRLTPEQVFGIPRKAASTFGTNQRKVLVVSGTCTFMEVFMWGAETMISLQEVSTFLEVTGAHYIAEEKLEVGSQLSLRLVPSLSQGK
jgi:hypothetical protein